MRLQRNSQQHCLLLRKKSPTQRLPSIRYGHLSRDSTRHCDYWAVDSRTHYSMCLSGYVQASLEFDKVVNATDAAFEKAKTKVDSLYAEYNRAKDACGIFDAARCVLPNPKAQFEHATLWNMLHVSYTLCSLYVHYSCVKAGALLVALETAKAALWVAQKAANAVLTGTQWVAVQTAKGALSLAEGALQLVRVLPSAALDATCANATVIWMQALSSCQQRVNSHLHTFRGLLNASICRLQLAAWLRHRLWQGLCSMPPRLPPRLC